MTQPSYSYPAHIQLAACLLFIVCALALAAVPQVMILDSDPLWHLAAGDLIRHTGTLPESDPWSFTSDGYRWLNIAWGWDVAASWLREHLGWRGPAALNAVTIAATLALIFTHCALRGGSTYLALLVTFGGLSTLIFTLRPLQLSHLMVALWALLLGQVARDARRTRWLIALPPLMLLWVNSHGGYIMGFVLLGAFGLQALITRNWLLFRPLFITGLACLAAICLTPYGLDIIETTRRPLTTAANSILMEWQPFTPSSLGITLRLMVWVFLILQCVRAVPMLPAERGLALLWCALSFTANRYLALFGILASPYVACAISTLIKRYVTTPRPTCRISPFLGQPGFARAALAGCALLCLSLFSPSSPGPELALPQLTEELAFLKKKKAENVLAYLNLATYAALESGGAVRIFVDPRTETAFPSSVIAEYVAFHSGTPGWQEMFARHPIQAVLLPSPPQNAVEQAIFTRMESLPGWKKAFSGPKAAIFLPSAN